MADSSQFKVIIVGGGPNGLYMANCLAAAGIDYLVLEQQPNIVMHQGALILLWCHTARLMHQLGLYDKLKARSFPAEGKQDILRGGYTISESSVWKMLNDNFGYDMFPMPRSDLIDVLYQNLPDKEQHVRCNASVVDIETDANGVRVHLGDGSVEYGSIVIGADGAYSKTRHVIQRKHAEDQGRQYVPEQDDPMVATYYGIYARADNTKLNIKPGIFFETRGTGITTQCMGSPEVLQCCLYKPLDKPVRGKQAQRYSREETQAFADEFGDVMLAPGVTFRDVWAAADKSSARLVNQDEGIAEHWHHGGRVVLLGDSACKMTSINGQGVNVGMHSAAILASELYDAVVAKGQTQQQPDAATLTEAFERYQRFRSRECQGVYQSGYDKIRETTWSTWSGWLMDRWVKPRMDFAAIVEKYLFPLVGGGQVLSYVPFEEKEGPAKEKWVRRPKTSASSSEVRAVL